MKRVCFLLACLYLLAMLSACSQPVNNSSDGPSTTTQDSTSSSSTVPNGSKKDELTVVFYHLHGAEEDISLSAEDCDILIRVAREANFAPMGPEGELNSIRDIRFTIRHYKAADNAFFADENVQYTDEDGNPTNNYVDVLYGLCYLNGYFIRSYMTTEGWVHEVAQIPEETIGEIKDHFSYLEDQQVPPMTNPPATVDTDAAIKAELIAKYGIPIRLLRNEGMALWEFVFTETTAERAYHHSLEGETYHKSLSWEIKNGELVISGDWNETFILALDANIAISKTDGEQYRVAQKDDSLAWYGVLQDMVLRWGFPIEFKVVKGMEQIIIRLYEGRAEYERKTGDQITIKDNCAWAIDGNRLRVFGDFVDSFIIDIDAGTATSQNDGTVYQIIPNTPE